MHTALYRGNALFTVGSSTIAALCVLATLSDVVHKSTPQVAPPSVVVDGLQKEGPNERAYLSFNLTFDLSSLFTWNTKQAFMYMLAEWRTDKHRVNQAVIWSHIAQTPEDARVSLPKLHVQYPYTLTDRGTSLVGREFNVSVAWETIPHAGALFAARRSFGGFRFAPHRIPVPQHTPGRAWS